MHSFDKLDKIGIEGVKEELIKKGFALAAIDRFIEAIETSALPAAFQP